MYNTKLMGTQKLICQLTVRAGKVVYDLNGISSEMWDAQPTSDIKQGKALDNLYRASFWRGLTSEIPRRQRLGCRLIYCKERIPNRKTNHAIYSLYKRDTLFCLDSFLLAAITVYGAEQAPQTVG